MSYQQITQYRTFDGKVFDEPDQAQEHVDDLICEEIEKLIAPSMINVPRRDIIKGVESICSNRKALRARLNTLLQLTKEPDVDDD